MLRFFDIVKRPWLGLVSKFLLFRKMDVVFLYQKQENEAVIFGFILIVLGL